MPHVSVSLTTSLPAVGDAERINECGNGKLNVELGEECDAEWDSGCTKECKCNRAAGFVGRNVRTLITVVLLDEMSQFHALVTTQWF